MTQNGITFNSVKTGTVKMGYWPITLQSQQGPDEDGGVINAVDIDWNGAFYLIQIHHLEQVLQSIQLVKSLEEH